MPIILPPINRLQFIKGSLALGGTAITASSSLAQAADQSVLFDQNRVALLADTHISADPNLSYPGTKWPGSPVKESEHERVEVLESGQGFGEGGYVEVKENVTAWRTEDALRVGEEFGVQPYKGGNMLRFSRMEVDVFGKKAEVSELVSVLDVRSLGANLVNGKTVVKSSVCFNQGVGIADGSTSFALSLHAIKREGQVSLATRREEAIVNSDVNPKTWERVESEIELPEGTDFVVVALSAQKEGSQALLPNLSGYYADGLEIAMVVDGRPVYSRL